MSALWAVLGFIVLQRLAELALAARNARRLRARGAVESGRQLAADECIPVDLRLLQDRERRCELRAREVLLDRRLVLQPPVIDLFRDAYDEFVDLLAVLILEVRVSFRHLRVGIAQLALIVELLRESLDARVVRVLGRSFLPRATCLTLSRLECLVDRGGQFRSLR